MGQLNNLDWEHVDIAALIAGIKHNGVISGLVVSESTTPAMTVLVSSGSCDVDDVRYTESSGQNLNISNGDATHPRKDIVVYDTTAGNPAVVAGTPAAAPIPPDIPSGDIYLAMIHVAANETTSIVNADIDEGRIFVQDHHHLMHEDGGTDVIDRFGTPSNVVGSRSAGTIYQNTADVPISVAVHGTLTTDTWVTFKFVISAASDMSGGFILDEIYYHPVGANERRAVSGIVPSSYYYRVTATNVSVSTWIEIK